MITPANRRSNTQWCSVAAILISLVIAGCGGGNVEKPVASDVQSTEKQATAVSARPTETLAVTSESASLNGPPQILQIEMVSEKRFDRTRFDYVFRILIGGALFNFESGNFKVSSSLKATTVLDSDINIGKISAGHYSRVPDTFTVRHDRTVPFNKNALSFSFAGTVLESPVTAAGPYSLGKIGFYKLGGRPGHQGLLEVNSSNPTLGDAVVLRVRIEGSQPLLKFELLGTSDKIISSGQLEKVVGIDGIYDKAIIVPTESFRVRIRAIPESGPSTAWTSVQFNPAVGDVKILFPDATFSADKPLIGKISIPPLPVSTSYSIKLILPDGFTSSTENWNVVTKSGMGAEIPISINIGKENAFRVRTIFIVWSNNGERKDFLSFATVMGL